MNNTENDKIKKYERLAVKKPKFYVSIGDLYFDNGDFKTATIYYQKAVDNGVLAYTVLGDTWGYRSQYKKAFDAYMEGANNVAKPVVDMTVVTWKNAYLTESPTDPNIS